MGTCLEVKSRGTLRGWLYQRLSEQGFTNVKPCVYGHVGRKDNKLQIPPENLQVKAACLSEIFQNPQTLHLGQENLKENMWLLF